MNYAYQQEIRPVLSLGKLGTTLTIPTFDILTNEPIGKCLQFENSSRITSGLSDYELFGDPLNQLYFDLWFKPVSLVPPGQVLYPLFKRTIGSGGSVSATFILFVDAEYNTRLTIRKSVGVVTTVSAQSKIRFGQWNHIGVVWDGTQTVAAGHNGYIWVNGIKTSIPLIAATIGAFHNDTPVVYSIGKYPTSDPLTGKYYIDELRIWSKAPSDDYFKRWARAPRAHGNSDADVDLIHYFRFDKESASPWVDDKPGSGGDSFAQGGTGANPTIITSEEYPSALGYSYPIVHIPLSGVGKNFTFAYPQVRPLSANWSLAVYFTDTSGNDQRYFLWKTSGLKGADKYALYEGQTINYTTARLEVWYNWEDRVCSLTSPLVIPLGIKQKRSSLVAENDVNLITLTADTDISVPLPAPFPITF